MEESSLFRIVIADDHSLIRQGLKSIIRNTSELEVVGEVMDGYELLALLSEVEADLVILDISMPRMGGLEAIGHIRAQFPFTEVSCFFHVLDRSELESLG